MCALCGEQRRLNYDGEIDRFDNKANMWVVFLTPTTDREEKV